MGSPNSSDDYSGEGGGAGGSGSNAGARGPGEEGRHHETAEEAESSLFFTAFSAFVSVSRRSLDAAGCVHSHQVTAIGALIAVEILRRTGVVVSILSACRR